MAEPILTWPRQEILLLLAVAQLALLTVVGWLISRRLARHIRFQQKLARRQVELTRAAATYRARGEDPHTTVRRIATNVIRRPIGELTPLRGGVAPTYLLFREDDSPLPWKRPSECVITPFNSGALALEEIADAWTALADRLGLLSVLPSVGRWELVELPPEEFER